MKHVYTIMLLCASCTVSAQVTYENGFFTDNAGKRTNCLIRDADGRTNPKKITYKLTESAESQTATIETVREFGVTGKFLYRRFTVDIDRSGNDLNSINEMRDPQFTREVLFLKVINEGAATLYAYSEGSMTRFFFSMDSSAPRQLVYKKYLVSQGNIAENNQFREQLWQSLRCDKLTMDQMNTLTYDTRSMNGVFTTYNIQCMGGQAVNYEQKTTRATVKLNITAGVNFSGLSYYNTMRNPELTEYGNNTGFRVGAEAEFIMPFNRNKWSLFLEPNYHSYSATNPNDPKAKVNYTAIQVPVGIRHYLFIGPKTKLYLNGSANFNINAGSSFQDIYEELEIVSNFNFGLGGGISFLDRFHLEYRYNSKMDILTDYIYITTNYNSSGLFLKYSLK